MLEQVRQDGVLKELLANCVCRLAIPDGTFRLPDGQGNAALFGDVRRFPRFRARGWAVLTYQSTFPALTRPAESHAAFLVGVSRGGVGLLHSQPLYPREQFTLVLPDGVTRQVEAAHYRRLGPQCFLVGGEFKQGQPTNAILTTAARQAGGSN